MPKHSVSCIQLSTHPIPRSNSLPGRFSHTLSDTNGSPHYPPLFNNIPYPNPYSRTNAPSNLAAAN